MVLFTVIYMFALKSEVFAQKHCAHILMDEPYNVSNVYIVKENSTVNVLFRLKPSIACENLSTYNISIGRYVNATVFETECYIQQTEDQCDNYSLGGNALCTCHSSKGRYVFTKTLSGYDNTIFRWKWLSERNGGWTDIRFNIYYPANVTHMTVNGYEIEDFHLVWREHSVLVACFWENGSPITSARLQKKDGKLLNTSYTSGVFIYHFRNISCQEMGIIECQSYGSERNRSLTLLVECPAIFMNSTRKLQISHDGGFINIDYTIISHTKENMRCKLEQYPDDKNTIAKIAVGIDVNNLPNPENCLMNQDESNVYYLETFGCLCNVSGIIPMLNVKMHISRVRKKHSGLWRFTVSNPNGSSHVDFYLHIDNETSPISEQVDTVDLRLAAGGIGIFCIALITIFTVYISRNFLDYLSWPSNAKIQSKWTKSSISRNKKHLNNGKEKENNTEETFIPVSFPIIRLESTVTDDSAERQTNNNYEELQT